MSEDRNVVVGSPVRNTPLWMYPIGTVIYPTTICKHPVFLSPASIIFLKQHPDYDVVCHDCVEALAILEGPPPEVRPIPGAMKELEDTYGKEITEAVVKEAIPEIERRTGAPYNPDSP